ncbi:hypothetical protein Tco_0116453 [Tanacetum coccineum]
MAEITFIKSLTQQKHPRKLSQWKHKLQVQEEKTSAINRALCKPWSSGWAYGLSLACFIQARACRLFVTPVLSKGVCLSCLVVKGTDNQEKDEKQSQNDKTGLGMEKTVKDKAKSKPESQSVKKSTEKSTGQSLEAKEPLGQVF